MPVQLFVPCFLDQAAPQAAQAMAALLDRLGVAWTYPKEQTCCGQFAYTLGDDDAVRGLMRHFLRVFQGDGPIVCPSASCAYLVRRHYPELARTPGERREIAAVSRRVWELSQWLAGRGPLPWTPAYQGTLALHQSCKARQLGALPAAARVLAQLPGLKLVHLSPYYSCCGFGGAFKFQHPDIAAEIGLAYLAAVREAGAQGLVSLDYSCLMHLEGLAQGRGWDMQFLHLAQVLVSP